MWAPVFLGAGMGVYFGLRFEPFIPVSVVVGVITASIALIIMFKAAMLRMIVWAAMLTFIGVNLASLRSHAVMSPVLSETYFGTIEGTVSKLDRSQTNRLRITLSDVVLYGLEEGSTPKRVRVTLPKKNANADVGTRIFIYAKLDAPGPPIEPGGFDFRRWAWFNQLGGVGFALGPIMTSATPKIDSIPLLLTEIRLKLSKLIRNEIPGPNGSFAAAILTGDRSAIDPSHLNNLRASNLAHLLAISGLHMGLLTGFIFALVRYGIALVPPIALRVPAKKVGAIAAMPVGLAYLLISGASVATQRAYVMAFVILIAVVLDRPAFTLRAVALAAIVVLLAAPESITQVGFQMSFAATIGLVAGFELLRKTEWWRRPVRGYKKLAKGVFSVGFSSFTAGLATAPFAAFHFNQIAQYGLLANLFAVPLMGSIVMPAAVTGLIFEIAGLGKPFFWLAGQGIGAILGIARFVAELEGAVVRVASGPRIILPLFAAGSLFAILLIGRIRFVGIPVAVSALCLWVFSERPIALINDTGRLVGVQTDEGRVLSKPRGDGFTAKSWLVNDGEAVTQKRSAMREGFKAEDGFTIHSSPHLSLIITETGSAKEVASLCHSFDIVVAPKLKSESQGDCTVLSPESMNITGAIAVQNRKGELVFIGAKEAAGRRLWTTPQALIGAD